MQSMRSYISFSTVHFSNFTKPSIVILYLRSVVIYTVYTLKILVTVYALIVVIMLRRKQKRN